MIAALLAGVAALLAGLVAAVVPGNFGVYVAAALGGASAMAGGIAYARHEAKEWLRDAIEAHHATCRREVVEAQLNGSGRVIAS